MQLCRGCERKAVELCGDEERTLERILPTDRFENGAKAKRCIHLLRSSLFAVFLHFTFARRDL